MVTWVYKGVTHVPSPDIRQTSFIASRPVLQSCPEHMFLLALRFMPIYVNVYCA